MENHPIKKIRNDLSLLPHLYSNNNPMAKDNKGRCIFNHSVNVILFFMFFIVLLAISLNGCFGTCKDKQNEQTVSEPIVNETTSPQDSLVVN